MAVVATQVQLWNVIEATDRLAEEGVSVNLVNPRTISPLDTETIADSVRKTSRCVVVDETPLSYGTQSHIGMEITDSAFFSLDFPVQRLGVDDVRILFSPPLEDEVVSNAQEIVEKVRELA